MTERSASTVLEILNRSEAFLRAHGCPSPRLDAQLLLAHVLGCERLRLYLDHDRPLSDSELSAARELVQRRGRREPVAYLIGEREFWSLPIRVDPRVLVPRPDSETLLEEVAARCSAPPPLRFADIGTGSGCLACALGRMFPQAEGLACDSDAGALAVAADNLERLGLSGRVRVCRGNLLEPLAGQTWDLITANLPYIPTDQLSALPPEVQAEPRRALDGGPDGLRWIDELVRRAPGVLRQGGWLVLELGDAQAVEVVERCRAAGLGQVAIRRDLGERQRVVSARRT